MISISNESKIVIGAKILLYSILAPIFTYIAFIYDNEESFNLVYIQLSVGLLSFIITCIVELIIKHFKPDFKALIYIIPIVSILLFEIILHADSRSILFVFEKELYFLLDEIIFIHIGLIAVFTLYDHQNKR